MKMQRKKRLRFDGLEVQAENDAANEIQLGFCDSRGSYHVSLTFAECRKLIHAIEQEIEWSNRLWKLRGKQHTRERNELIEQYLGKIKPGSPIKKG